MTMAATPHGLAVSVARLGATNQGETIATEQAPTSKPMTTSVSLRIKALQPRPDGPGSPSEPRDRMS